MNGFNVMFIKSTDHGAHWSAPVKTYGSVSWNDKPILAVSDNGNDVYVMFNGPTGGDPWLAQSHNAGSTWTQTKLVDSNRYIFAFDGDVDANGTAYFAMTSILYGGGGNKGTTPTGAIEEHVFVVDRTTARPSRTGSSAPPSPGSPASRPAARRTTTSATRAITAYAHRQGPLLYDGATTSGGPQTITAKPRRTAARRGRAGRRSPSLARRRPTPAVEAAQRNGDVRALVLADQRRRQRRRLERLVPHVDRRRAHVDRAGQDLRRDRGAAYKTAGGLRRGLRRLRRDRDHLHRQDDRRLGRGRQLRRPGRGLDQPPELVPELAGLRPDDERAQGDRVDHQRDREVADRRLHDTVEVLADPHPAVARALVGLEGQVVGHRHDAPPWAAQRREPLALGR